MSAPWSGRRLHFVGVGGAGMSGYARAAHALGAQISGSDRADSPYLERLRADGVLEASIGHDAANVPAGEDVEVVYSSAVPAREPRAGGGARAGVARAAPRGAAGRAERAAAHDRGGGHARQDDDRVDARAHPARRRRRPWLAGGRASRWRSAQRALGRGRVAGGGGRRVRPLDAHPRRGGRGAHQRGARPPRELCLAGGAARGLPRVPRARARRRRRVGSP